MHFSSSLIAVLFSLAACANQDTDKTKNANMLVSLKNPLFNSIEIPGVRPGKFRAASEKAHMLILFNGFPGEPGITVHGLCRTWIYYPTPTRPFCHAIASTTKLASVTRKTASGIQVICEVFDYDTNQRPSLDQLNAKPYLDAGFRKLEYLPATFVFSITQKDKTYKFILVGSPVDQDYGKYAKVLLDSLNTE